MKKRILSVLAIMAIFITSTSYALAAELIDSGQCGHMGYFDVQWALDSDGILTISGEGQMTWWDTVSNEVPWYKHHTSITKVIIESGITNLP